MLGSLFKRLTSSKSEGNLSDLASEKSTSTPSSNRRASLSKFEVVVPSKKSLSSGSRTPSRSTRSPGSDRSTTPQTVSRSTHVNGSGKSHQSPKRLPEGSTRPKIVEVPPSPPKRARFEDVNEYKTARPSISTQSASSRESSSLVHKNDKASGPTRPSKRKREDVEEEEGDKSLELEVVPYISSRPAKIHRPIAATSSNKSPITIVAQEKTTTSHPSSKALSNKHPIANDKERTTTSHPSPKASSSKAPIVIELNSDSESDSDDNISDSGTRDASPELPEPPHLASPKKIEPKIDIKGKGKAIEPIEVPIKAIQKPKPFPIDAEFHSLDELGDFEDDIRPAYAFWVLARCAILGSKIDKLTLEGILSRICERYPYYHFLASESGSEERVRLEGALKSAMAQKLCFTITREQRGIAWYGVDKHVNPHLKRPPAAKKGESMIEAGSAGSTAKGSHPGSSGSSRQSVASVKAAPVLPPPKPQYVAVAPERLPQADLEIFATHLQHLRNADPIDDEISTAKEKTASVDGKDDMKSANTKGGHTAVLNQRIPYELWVPVRAAILGSPFRKLKMQALLKDLVWKYPRLSPPDEQDSWKKLQQSVGNILVHRACFFRVRLDNHRNDIAWMVDPAVDPREKKLKFKWTPVPYKERPQASEAAIANALGLAIDGNVPPSATSSEVVESLNLRPPSGEAMMLEFRQALRDLKDMDAFYREREEKWNRRTAYIHESGKMVLVQPEPSTDVPAPSNIVEEHEEDDDDTAQKEPSPELEEVALPRKPGSAVKARTNGTHPLAKQIFHDDIVDSSDEDAPSTSAATSATYVCGYSDTRTGIICETRLSTREERETHQRFVHSVRNSKFDAKSRFTQEATMKMKKQLEQERVNKKVQAKKPRKRESDGHGVSMLARKAMHAKIRK